MLVNDPMKFHYDNLKIFQVTERTRPKGKFHYFPFQRAIIQKIYNPELQILNTADRLMLVDIL